MPHSDDSVSLHFPVSFTVPIASFSPHLAAMTSEQTHVHVARQDPESLSTWRRKMVEKVFIKDSSQMSLIHYCIVKEML